MKVRRQIGKPLHQAKYGIQLDTSMVRGQHSQELLMGKAIPLAEFMFRDKTILVSLVNLR